MRKSTKNLILLFLLITTMVIGYSNFGVSARANEYFRFEREPTTSWVNDNDIQYNSNISTSNIDRQPDQYQGSYPYNTLNNFTTEPLTSNPTYGFDGLSNQVGYHLADYMSDYNMSIGDDYTDLAFPTTSVVGTNCSINVSSGSFLTADTPYNDFNKVVNFTDKGDAISGASSIMIRDFGTNVIDDEFEWWWGKNTTATDSTFSMYIREGSTYLVYLKLQEDDIYYGTGGGTAVLSNVLEVDTMYHFEVEMDDSANTFDLYIDGILEGNDLAYSNPSTNGADNIGFSTLENHANYEGYVSSLGLIARSGWYIEDININENGLLDILESPMKPEIENHSFNTTLKVEPVGSQEYEATYTFEEGKGPYTNGEESECISEVPFIENVVIPTSCSIEIQDNYNHKNILNLYDGNNGERVILYNYFENQMSGVMELWVRSSNMTGGFYIHFYDESNRPFILRFVSDSFWFYDGSWNSLTSVSDNTWYHLKIDFDLNTNYDLYLNGNLEGNNLNYNDNGSISNGLDSIRIISGGEDNGYNVQLDAIGYSWDSDYNIGDNLDYSESRLLFNDTSNHATDGYVGITDYFSENRENGVIDLNVHLDDPTDRVNFYIKDGTFNGILLQFDDEKISIYDGSGTYVDLVDGFNEDYIHFLQIRWDISDGGFYINLNGTDYGMFDFYGSGFTYFDRLVIQTVNTDTDYVFRMDNVGYSWEGYEYWAYGDKADGSIFNVNEYKNHLNVLALVDDETTKDTFFIHDVGKDLQEFGITTEFYFDMDFYADDSFVLNTTDQYGVLGVDLKFKDYGVSYWSPYNNNYTSIFDSIELDDTDMIYTKIRMFYDTYDILLRNNEFTFNYSDIPYVNPIDNYETLEFYTNITETNYVLYLDSIGIDGLNGYSENDNIFVDDYQYEVDKWNWELNPNTRREFKNASTNHYENEVKATDICGWYESTYTSTYSGGDYNRYSDSTENWIELGKDNTKPDSAYSIIENQVSVDNGNYGRISTEFEYTELDSGNIYFYFQFKVSGNRYGVRLHRDGVDTNVRLEDETGYIDLPSFPEIEVDERYYLDFTFTVDTYRLLIRNSTDLVLNSYGDYSWNGNMDSLFIAFLRSAAATSISKMKVYNVGYYVDGKSLNNESIGSIAYDFTDGWENYQQLRTYLNGTFAIEYINNPTYYNTYQTTFNRIGKGNSWYYDYNDTEWIYPIFPRRSNYYNLWYGGLFDDFAKSVILFPKGEFDVNNFYIETLAINHTDYNNLTHTYYPNIDFNNVYYRRNTYGKQYWIDTQNRLNFYFNSTQDDTLEYSELWINITEKSIGDLNLSVPMVSYGNATFYSRVELGNNTDIYTYANHSLANSSLLPQGNYFDKIAFRFTDNNYNNLTDTTTYGYVEYVALIDPIWLEFHLQRTTNFLVALPVIILLVIPSLIIYQRVKHPIIIPAMILAMNVVAFAVNLIPTWLFFIISVGILFYIFFSRKQNNKIKLEI